MQFRRQGVAAVAIVVPLALSGTAIAGGDDNDHGNPHGTPPGQAVAEQTPSHDTAPNGQAKGAEHAQKAKGHAKAKAKGHAKAPKKSTPVRAHGKPAKKAPAANNPYGHGPSGKTTICHATGSATNPYVTITISNNAIPAHKRHQDGRDIIPAPAEGCPAAASAGQSQSESSGQRTATPGTTAPAAAAPVVVAPVAANQTAPSTAAPQSGVEGETAGGGTTASRGTTAPAVAGNEGTTTSHVLGTNSSGSSLPFTGSDVVLVVIAALGLLLAGFALRRSLTRPRPTA